MRSRRSFAAISVAFVMLSPHIAGAQDSLACDGSIPAAQGRARLANTIAHVGLFTQVAGVIVTLANTHAYRPGQPTDRTGMHVGFVMQMTGLAATFGSIPISRSARYSATAVDDAIQQIKVGETSSDDVHRCLGDPTTRTFDVQPGVAVQTQPAEESWVYRFRGRSGFFRRTVLRTITISFKGNVVSRVHVAESR